MGWVLVRAFGIIVGIATLLRLAKTEKLVTYDPLFLAWMDWLSDIVELGVLTKLIGPFLHSAFDYVRSLGIPVPDLQDEWRPVFVLSLLVLGAAARNLQTGWFVVAAPCLALACAIVAGLTGTYFPVAVALIATLFFVLAYTVLGLRRYGVPRRIFAAVAAFCCAVLVITGAGIDTGIAAALYVAVFAFAMVSFAAFFGGQNRVGETGFDVLAAMLGALGLASWFANPPIW